jgi:hypothetical protein
MPVKASSFTSSAVSAVVSHTIGMWLNDFFLASNSKAAPLVLGYMKRGQFFLLLTFGRFLEYEGTSKFVLFD